MFVWRGRVYNGTRPCTSSTWVCLRSSGFLSKKMPAPPRGTWPLEMKGLAPSRPYIPENSRRACQRCRICFGACSRVGSDANLFQSCLGQPCITLSTLSLMWASSSRRSRRIFGLTQSAWIFSLGVSKRRYRKRISSGAATPAVFIPAQFCDNSVYDSRKHPRKSICTISLGLARLYRRWQELRLVEVVSNGRV